MDRSLPLFAGVELGGTKCVCILAAGPDDVREQVRIDTGAPEATLAAITDVLTRWSAGEGFAAIGVASFGPLELDPQAPAYGAVVNTSKPGWNGTDILAPLSRFEVPIALDTDVNGAALAEGRWGAAQGLESFAYVTVGTGVGVGSVVRGRTVRGLGHSEAGHQRIARPSGAAWPGVCPYHGDCVEGLASGPAIAARAGRAADQLDAQDSVWDEVVPALAGLFHNLVLTTAPQRILLGGGVGGGRPFMMPRLRRALLDSLGGYGVGEALKTSIDAFLVTPALGDRAGPLGAITLAMDAASACSG